VAWAHGPDIVYSNTTDLGYYEPAGGKAQSTVDVWFNDMANGNHITGYTISGLPGDGVRIVSIDLTGGFEFSAPNLIPMSLGFNSSDSPEAGWLLADPPSVGASTDDFYSWTDGAWYRFGGNPVVNFHTEIAMAPEPGTVTAVGAGLVGLLGLRRRK
jgi:hypothetical protein